MIHDDLNIFVFFLIYDDGDELTAYLGTWARVFESCKDCVTACFGVCQCVRVHFMVQVSDLTCRMIGFVLLMYSLYG